MRAVVVMSNTWYGRGNPKTSGQIQSGIELAVAAIRLVAPEEPVYGYCDEDYGWAVPLTPEQEESLRSRFPKSLEEHGVTYLTNQDSEAMLVDGYEVIVTIIDVDAKAFQAQPIPPTFEAMFNDWFANYGCN